MIDLSRLERSELERLAEDLSRRNGELEIDQKHTLNFLRTFTRSDFARPTKEIKEEIIAYTLTQAKLFYGLDNSTFFEYDRFRDCFVGSYSLGSTTTEEWIEAMRGLLEMGDIGEVGKQALNHLVPIELVIHLDAPSVFKTLREERRSNLGQQIEYTLTDRFVVDSLGEPFVAITLKGEGGKAIGFIYGSNNVTGDPIEISREKLESFNRIRYPTAQLLEFINVRQTTKHTARRLSRGLGAAEVAHEVRKGIQVVGGFTRQIARMLREGDYESTTEPIGIILEEIDLLERQLRTVTDFGIPLNPKPEKFDILSHLGTLVENIANACSHLRLQTLEYQIDADVPELYVYADRNHLVRPVLSNMVNNAVEAMADEGTSAGYVEGMPNVLTIKVRAGEENGLISIRNRQYINPGILAKLEAGERFGTTKGVSGTGLGVSIAVKYAMANNCELGIESNETDGTTVSLSIPYDPA